MGNKNICFVSPEAYPILAGTDDELVGGAELQQVLLAKELAKNGYEVSFIVGDFGQDEIEIIDGVKAIKSYKLGYGNRKLRFMHDTYLLMKAMKKANADIYFQRCVFHTMGKVALFTNLHKKKFVFSAGSDLNINLSIINSLTPLYRYTYLFGLKVVDVIVVQSDFQKNAFKKYFNKTAIVIRNASALPNVFPCKTNPSVVLWVGSLSKTKNPQLFMELAKSLPWISFEIIGPPRRKSESIYKKLKQSARRISNLSFLGFVPYEKLMAHFAKAAILVNTSETEGFPNTFLQAWVHYVPVVSLNVNPDGIITKNKIGFHSRNFEQMLKDVKRLAQDGELREEMGNNSRKYVERDHNIKKIVREYIKLFESL